MLELTLCHGIHAAMPRIPWGMGVAGVKEGERDF